MTDPNQPTQPLNPTPPPYAASPAGHVWPAGVSFNWQQWRNRLQPIWQNSSLTARWILSVGTVLLIIGCGAASVVGVAILQRALAKPDGYLWSDPTDVVFLQFTEDSTNHITGTMHSVAEASDQTINAEDIGFTGVANGSHINLTFSAFGLSSTFAGTLNGDTLILQVPDQNGYIATDIFHAASVQDYNNAVAQLRQLVTKHIAATQSAQATVTMQSALDNAVTSANNQLADDLNSLTSDIGSLKNDSDFSDALNAYAGDWTQMQTDYQQEQTDYQQGCGSNGSNAVTVANDSVTVNNDHVSIGNDDVTLSNSVNSFKSDLSRLQQDITNAQSDWQNLQAAEAADTIGTALAQFTANDVNNAVTNAQIQMNASNKALTDAQSKASAYDKEAAQMNVNAQNLANSMNC